MDPEDYEEIIDRRRGLLLLALGMPGLVVGAVALFLGFNAIIPMAVAGLLAAIGVVEAMVAGWFWQRRLACRMCKGQLREWPEPALRDAGDRIYHVCDACRKRFWFGLSEPTDD